MYCQIVQKKKSIYTFIDREVDKSIKSSKMYIKKDTKQFMQENPWRFKVDPYYSSLIKLLLLILGVSKLSPLYLFFFPEMLVSLLTFREDI